MELRQTTNQLQPIIPSSGDLAADTIPAELRTRKQWVCYETVNGRKVPMQPSTTNTTPASVTNSQTWCSYEEARQGKKYGFEGIGFVFTKNDPYCGIDLDDCRDPKTGITEEWALKVINDF